MDGAMPGRSGPWSEAAGERACWPPYGAVLDGELECDEGVGRPFGEAAEWAACIGGGRGLMPGSSFGAMLELDRRDW